MSTLPEVPSADFTELHSQILLQCYEVLKRQGFLPDEVKAARITFDLAEMAKINFALEAIVENIIDNRQSDEVALTAASAIFFIFEVQRMVGSSQMASHLNSILVMAHNVGRLSKALDAGPEAQDEIRQAKKALHDRRRGGRASAKARTPTWHADAKRIAKEIWATDPTKEQAIVADIILHDASPTTGAGKPIQRGTIIKNLRVWLDSGEVSRGG